MNIEQNSLMDMDDPAVIEGIANQVSELRHLPFTAEDSKDLMASTDKPQVLELDADNLGVSGVIVADTNYLISQLRFFTELVDLADRCGDILVVIPSVVVWELDGLKKANGIKAHNSTHSPDLAVLARDAIDFLYKRFLTNGSLRGQKLSEVLNTKAENNDDKILDCCRYFGAFFSCPLVLLSNDKNLCIKAMVHEIRACSFWRKTPLELFQEYLPTKYQTKSPVNVSPPTQEREYVPIPYEDIDMEDAIDQLSSRAMVGADLPPENKLSINNVSEIPIITTSRISGKASLGYTDSSPEEVLLAVNTLADKVCTAQPPIINIDLAPRWDYASRDPLHQLYFVVDVILKQFHVVLVFGMLRELENSLGEDWKIVVNRQPPWMLEDLLMLLTKHYHSVFSDTFPNKQTLETCIYNIESFLKAWTRLKTFNLGYIYKKDINRILHDLEYILQVQREAPNNTALVFLWSHELSKIDCP